MDKYENADFFTDPSLIDDPYPYFDYLREKGPITRLKSRNVVAVTGFEEAVKISLDATHFSSVNAVLGGLVELPFEAKGDDITEQIERHRDQMPYAKEVVALDGLDHVRMRSLLTSLFTPSRLKAKDAGFRAVADHLINEFVDAGEFDLVRDYAGPYATLIIAELLGIPEADRPLIREYLKGGVLGDVNVSAERNLQNPLVKLGMKLAEYIMGRRENPRDDVLTELATARFPDGALPTIEQATRLAAFLFGAGQDTTVRLLANAFRVLGDRADLQELLQADPAKIPDFIEEALRFEGSVKSAGRLCVRSTRIAGVKINAGDKILLTYLGANRDPRRFPDPGDFKLDRPKAKDHMAFGRGPHTCIGAPLARLETKISLEHLFRRLGTLRISQKHHGPAGARRFEYKPTYVLRAMVSLHLQFAPKGRAP